MTPSSRTKDTSEQPEGQWESRSPTYSYFSAPLPLALIALTSTPRGIPRECAPPRARNPALGGGGTKPPRPLPPLPIPAPPPGLPLPRRPRADAGGGLSATAITSCSMTSESSASIRFSFSFSSLASPTAVVVVVVVTCGCCRGWVGCDAWPKWRATGRPLRVANPALPREAPRPKRIEEGTRPRADTPCVSSFTASSPALSSLIFSPSAFPSPLTAGEAEETASTPSASLWSSSAPSESSECRVDDGGKDAPSSSAPSSSSSSLLSRGSHCPRSRLAPSPQRRSKPPMPLLVMAKKYSFGYACADMRCSLLVFGVANTRGQEDRWHANCGEGQE
jgi:hypothetical protein